MPANFVAIMGPSGCGKSTLMHLLGAMTRATSGKVLIEGQDTAGMNDRREPRFEGRSSDSCFRNSICCRRSPRAQNIEVARKIHGEPRTAEGIRIWRKFCTLLQIEEKLDRRPSELSGGEQQRVAIARALTNRPAILLADEPTGALDTKNSEIVLRMFQELNKRFKQTILLVTHNPELAPTRIV